MGRTRAIPFLFFLCGVGTLYQDVQVFAVPSPAQAFLPPAANCQVDYKRDIEPILSKNCYGCHGPTVQMRGLRWDNRRSALAGSDAGPVVEVGDSAHSKMILMVAGAGDKLMPPLGERLNPEQIGLLRAWIDQGMKWPEEQTTTTSVTGHEGIPKATYWAFIPPQRPQIPSVQNHAWVRNPIDAFVLATMEEEGINPSPEVDRVQLIRRVTLDLIGLLPTIREVDQFLADKRPDAYERLVDRLLGSPHYGEKWARPWLDLARYADSDGYNDGLRPYAWRYRQWVVDALNANLPFDEFTIEQLAGDLLPNATIDQKIATGFNRNTLTNRETGTDREEFRMEQVIDRTSTLGTVWLGLTVGCARCHDHKYDPIKQKEFYELSAFFNTEVERNIDAPLPGEAERYRRNRAVRSRKRQELLNQYHVAPLQLAWEKKTREAADNSTAELQWVLAWKRIGWLFDGGQDILRMDPCQRSERQQDRLTDFFIRDYHNVVGDEAYKKLKFKELTGKLAAIEEEYPDVTEAQTLAENPDPPKTHILIRGDFRRPGMEVEPATPAFLPPLLAERPISRLTLARWLVSKDNPLTARVTVNRMWQGFFGRGLVETSEDFGTRGDRPTHPELLDWLATEFMANQWDVKRMHKLIVMSATYRQSSKIRKDLLVRDPDNKLLARQARLRLSAELIRDVTLAASGMLNPAVGGKSVRLPLPAGVADLSLGTWKLCQGAECNRRGIYIVFKRVATYPELVNFNAPDAQQSCSRRERSTTPLQALNLLNDPVFFGAAQDLAVRVLRERPASLSDQIQYAFRLCLSRAPTPTEKDRLMRYYDEEKGILERNPQSIGKLSPTGGAKGMDPEKVAVWVGLGTVLLNLEEFITRG